MPGGPAAVKRRFVFRGYVIMIKNAGDGCCIFCVSRYQADSNCCNRFCRPVPNLSAMVPNDWSAKLHLFFCTAKFNLPITVRLFLKLIEIYIGKGIGPLLFACLFSTVGCVIRSVIYGRWFFLYEIGLTFHFPSFRADKQRRSANTPQSNCQLSIVSSASSAPNCQLSIVSSASSAPNCQLSIVSCQF